MRLRGENRLLAICSRCHDVGSALADDVGRTVRPNNHSFGGVYSSHESTSKGHVECGGLPPLSAAWAKPGRAATVRTGQGRGACTLSPGRVIPQPQLSWRVCRNREP